MTVKRRAAFPRRQDPELNRALGDVRRAMRRQETTVTEERIISTGRRGGGGGGGGDGGGLQPYAGSSIEVFVYNQDDPANPVDSIGTTTTDAAGFWEIDIAEWCLTNDFMEPFPITIARNGAVIRHEASPATLSWLDSGVLLSVYVNGQELQA